jgi:hypothetical protein
VIVSRDSSVVEEAVHRGSFEQESAHPYLLDQMKVGILAIEPIHPMRSKQLFNIFERLKDVQKTVYMIQMTLGIW